MCPARCVPSASLSALTARMLSLRISAGGRRKAHADCFRDQVCRFSLVQFPLGLQFEGATSAVTKQTETKQTNKNKSTQDYQKESEAQGSIITRLCFASSERKVVWYGDLTESVWLWEQELAGKVQHQCLIGGWKKGRFYWHSRGEWKLFVPACRSNQLPLGNAFTLSPIPVPGPPPPPPATWDRRSSGNWTSTQQRVGEDEPRVGRFGRHDLTRRNWYEPLWCRPQGAPRVQTQEMEAHSWPLFFSCDVWL